MKSPQIGNKIYNAKIYLLQIKKKIKANQVNQVSTTTTKKKKMHYTIHVYNIHMHYASSTLQNEGKITRNKQ